MLLRSLFILAAVLGCSALIPRSPHYWKRRSFEAKRRDQQYPWLQTRNFTQLVDHFDPNNKNTWQQKYYYNDLYYRNRSIVFLMIGGEGPETPHWAAEPTVQYIQWAQEYGALVLDLEHRFFGDSWPIPNMNTDTLRLLTSRQALADLANFIKTMNVQLNLVNPRWVTFGGSYPGALNAWFREKYPELTVGAVASSAVVNLKLDFYEYAMGVNDDLWVTNTQCAQPTKDAFTKIQQLSMTKAGRQKLNQQLNLAPPFDDNTTKLDITNLFGNLYNIYQGMSQYTYDGQSRKTETVETDQTVCNIMMDKNTPDPVDRVYNLIKMWDSIYGDNSTNPAFPNSYTDSMNTVNTGNLSVIQDANGDDAARGWMWLCCNELGFMQTTDMGDNVFGSTIPLNYFIDMCTDMFGNGIAMDHVYSTNQAAQDYYGGADNYNATNVVLPNGSMDPWHYLGAYLNSTALNATAILINGTAHCSDMYPSYDGEPAGLKPARATIKQQVQMFIQYDPVADGPTPAPTTQVVTSPTTPVTRSSSFFNVCSVLLLLGLQRLL